MKSQEGLRTLEQRSSEWAVSILNGYWGNSIRRNMTMMDFCKKAGDDNEMLEGIVRDLRHRFEVLNCNNFLSGQLEVSNKILPCLRRRKIICKTSFPFNLSFLWFPQEFLRRNHNLPTGETSAVQPAFCHFSRKLFLRVISVQLRQ